MLTKGKGNDGSARYKRRAARRLNAEKWATAIAYFDNDSSYFLQKFKENSIGQ
jgi:hypothetical protein